MYQPEFEERWAIGLVSQHDPLTHIMEITMDEVTQRPNPQVVMETESKIKGLVVNDWDQAQTKIYQGRVSLVMKWFSCPHREMRTRWWTLV